MKTIAILAALYLAATMLPHALIGVLDGATHLIGGAQ